MPQLKINKQLNRPDGGIVAPGSIANCNSPQPVVSKKAIRFPFKLMLNQQAIEDEKKVVPEVEGLPFILIMKCTDEEWEQVENDPGGPTMALFFQKSVEAKIGAGTTEIIID